MQFFLPAQKALGIGVVIFEMFEGLLEQKKDKKAYRYIMETRQNFGGKPHEKLLKAILKKDPGQRPTCKEVLRLETFREFPRVEFKKVVTKTLIHRKNSKNSKKRRNNAASRQAKMKKTQTSKKSETLSKYEKLCKKFDFENPITALAAEIYHNKTKENMVDCVLLASKIYEYYTVDILEDVGKTIEDFDLERYILSEKRILMEMDYCLFV